MKYHCFIIDTSTQRKVEIPFSSIQIVDELNKGKQCTITMSYEAVRKIAAVYGQSVHFLLSGALREITVEKDTSRIYYGVISDLSLQQNQQGDIGLTIASVGFFSLFAKRRTGVKRVFTNTDAGQIAWTIINESQQSDLPYSNFGITQGLIQTSVSRDRTFRFASVKDEIEQMSNLNLKNGFDLEINDLKQFNVYYPQKGQDRPQIVLDEENILSWRYRKPLILSLANKVHVVGNGFNDDVLYVTRESSSDYKTTFKLLEEVVSERDVITSATLQDKGDRFLLDNQSPRVELQLTHLDDELDVLTYEVGDSVRVQIAELEIANISKRIYKRSMQISDPQTIVTLDLK